MKVEIIKLGNIYHIYDINNNKEIWTTTNKFALFLAIIINNWDIQKQTENDSNKSKRQDEKP